MAAFVQPSITISQRQLNDFGALAREITTTTRRTMQGVVDQASIMFAQSAAKHSPVSKKWRPVEKNPGYRRRKKGDPRRLAHERRYRYRFHSQSKSYWRYQDDRAKTPGRKITYRGALANSWKAIQGKVGRIKRRPRLVGPAATRTRKYLSAVSANERRNVDDPQTTMKNRMSYLLDATPDVAEVAMRKTQARLDKSLEAYRDKLKKQWEDR